MGVLRQIAKRAMTVTMPTRRFVTRVPGDGICLTFDDGPDPRYTPAILDHLAACGIRVTFFVVGERAQRNRQLLRDMISAGHELGNHTWTHSEPRCTSTRRFMAEVRRTSEFIEQVTGRACRLVRPPKGALTAGKLIGLLREQYSVALWSVDSKDYRMSHESQMQTWCESWTPQAGDVVLMHDNRPFSVVASRILAERHDIAGPCFRTVSECLEHSVS